MQEKLSRVLFTVAEDVLGKLAFVFCFPDDERAPIDRASSVGIQVSFSGPFSGHIDIFITRDALPEIAGNMLGVEMEETSETEQMDALKEIGNVICGNLLPEIAGPDAVFNVGSPETIDISAHPSLEAAPPLAMMKLSLEDGESDIMLYIAGGLPDLVSGHLSQGGDDSF